MILRKLIHHSTGGRIPPDLCALTDVICVSVVMAWILDLMGVWPQTGSPGSDGFRTTLMLIAGVALFAVRGAVRQKRTAARTEAGR